MATIRQLNVFLLYFLGFVHVVWMDGRLQLYCAFHRPDTSKWMVFCGGCGDWYHGCCVRVREADGDLVGKYHCMQWFPLILSARSAAQRRNCSSESQ